MLEQSTNGSGRLLRVEKTASAGVSSIRLTSGTNMMSGSEKKLAEQEVVITNKTGLHARAATQIVEVANKFKSDIVIYKDDQIVNAKSVMDIILLAAESGTKLKIRAEGDDAEEAVSAITELVKNKFGEE